MVEVQAHGFSFEKWVRDHFFAGYTGGYMQKWDVPAEHNTSDAVLPVFRNLPVSIKTAKIGSPIGLGDGLRQRQIDQPFVMIVGFWKQQTSVEKWILDIGCTVFEIRSWQRLWGELTLGEIHEIDLVVKNQSEHYSIVRTKARAWKMQPAVATSTIVINPKIDSKTQRRIQCSLPYKAFWAAVGREASSQNEPELWGHVFPNPIKSSARKFNA